MIAKAILAHDLHRMIKDFRFVILMVIGVLLFALNGFMFARSYIETSNYQAELRLMPTQPVGFPTEIRPFSQINPLPTNGAPPYPRPSTVATELYVPPNPWRFIASGRTTIRPDVYDVRPGGIITPFYVGGQNPLMDNAPALDWSYITVMLVCLYALLFGHAAISQERENGTLMLIFANQVKRPVLLITRYLSIMIVLIASLFQGSAITLAVFLVRLPEIVSGEFIARVLLALGAGVMVLSLVTLMSMVCSIRIRRSSLSLLVLLLAWMALLALPQVSGSIVALRYGDLNASRFETRQKELIAATEATIDRRFLHPGSPEFVGAFRSMEEALAALMPYEDELAHAQQKNYDAYLDAILTKADRVRLLNRLSPLGLYMTIVERIAETDVRAERRFRAAVMAYARMYDAYILETTGEIVPQCRVMPNRDITRSAILIDDRGRLGRALYPNVVRNREYNGDKSDFPGFDYRAEPLEDIARESLSGMAGLILWNLVLAVAAFAVFNRADVR